MVVANEEEKGLSWCLGQWSMPDLLKHGIKVWFVFPEAVRLVMFCHPDNEKAAEGSDRLNFQTKQVSALEVECLVFLKTFS